MSDSISSLTDTITGAIASLPPGAPAFGVDLVQAVLGTEDPTTAYVLNELLDRGVVVATSGREYMLIDPVTAAGDGQAPDTDTGEAAAAWFIRQALLADHARDRSSKKISPDYDDITVPKFCTPGEATRWYEPHHAWYLDLLHDLVDRAWHERALTLAEAVIGLAGHLGHQQDQLRVVKEALRALNYLQDHFFGLVDERDDEDTDVRHHHVRVARYQLMLAVVLTNLGEYGAALKALGEAERRGRAADSNRVLAAVCRSRGRLHHAAGDLPEADRQLRTAYVADLGHGDLRVIALSLRRRGAVLSDLGDFDQAGELLRTAAVYTTELGLPIANARVLTTFGAMHIASGQFEKAVQVLHLALSTMNEHDAGCDRYLADIYRHLAYAQRGSDRDAADECLRKAAEYYRTAHDHDAATALETEWHQAQVAA